MHNQMQSLHYWKWNELNLDFHNIFILFYRYWGEEKLLSKAKMEISELAPLVPIDCKNDLTKDQIENQKINRIMQEDQLRI